MCRWICEFSIQKNMLNLFDIMSTKWWSIFGPQLEWNGLGGLSEWGHHCFVLAFYKLRHSCEAGGLSVLRSSDIGSRRNDNIARSWCTCEICSLQVKHSQIQVIQVLQVLQVIQAIQVLGMSTDDNILPLPSVNMMMAVDIALQCNIRLKTNYWLLHHHVFNISAFITILWLRLIFLS